MPSWAALPAENVSVSKYHERRRNCHEYRKSRHETASVSALSSGNHYYYLLLLLLISLSSPASYRRIAVPLTCIPHFAVIMKPLLLPTDHDKLSTPLWCLDVPVGRQTACAGFGESTHTHTYDERARWNRKMKHSVGVRTLFTIR